MSNENNKLQVDIENLFKQNVNDLSSIKELYRKLKEVEEKISQIKYIDSALSKKFKKEYEKLKKIILDENIQIKLTNDIETINSQLETKTSKSEGDILLHQNFGVANHLDGQIYDFFDVEDRILNGSKTISGHTWSVSGPGMNNAQVKNGELTTDTNFYASLDYGKTIKYMQTTYHWDNIDSGDEKINDNVVMILQSSKGDLTNMIHLICGKTGFSLTKRINGGDFIVIPTPVLEPYLLEKGEIYSSSMYLDGNKLITVDAMGNKCEIIDDDFELINPTKMTIQIGPQPNSSWKGKFHSVVVGEKEGIDTSFLKNYGVNKKELQKNTKRIMALEGYDYTKKQYLRNVTIPSSGWYTVARETVFGGNIIAGKIKVNSQFKSSGSVTMFESNLSMLSNGVIDVSGFGSRIYQVIDKIRLAKDSSNKVYLDFHFKDSSTYPATIDIEFQGFFNVIQPTLANTSYVTEFYKEITSPPLDTKNTFIANTNNYYTIARQSISPLGYQMAGKCTILAENLGGYVCLDCLIQASPGTMGTLTVTKVYSNGTRPITNVRISGDSSSKINLDLEFRNAQTYATTVKIKFDDFGYYTINPIPIGGVNSLSPGSKEKIEPVA